MVTVNVSYPDFTNGEVSPRLAGRYDLQAFYKGGSRVENFISEVSGSASYRNGLIYVNGTKSNNKAFLYTFEFSDALSFVLEFTAGKIRFYRDNGIIESGGFPYEVTTTYAEADLFGLKFAQNRLSLYIVHPNYPPKKLTYISSTNWTFATHAAYESEGSVITITGITKSNPAVVTYSGSDNLSNGHTIFIQGVNGMVELNDRLFTVANVNTSANTFELSGENSSSYVAYVSDGTATHVGDADFLTAGSYPSLTVLSIQFRIYLQYTILTSFTYTLGICQISAFPNDVGIIPPQVIILPSYIPVTHAPCSSPSIKSDRIIEASCALISIQSKFSFLNGTNFTVMTHPYKEQLTEHYMDKVDLGI